MYETPFNDKNPRRTMKVGGTGAAGLGLLNAQQRSGGCNCAADALGFTSDMPPVDNAPGEELWWCAAVLTYRLSLRQNCKRL